MTQINNRTQIKNQVVLYAATYNFAAQTPGGTLSANVTNTIALSPVPLGVNGTDANHYLYISNGAGTAEAVRITGGTAVAGAASGTITFVPAFNHSGAWTIQPATAGISEAIIAANGSAKILLDAATLTMHAPATRRANCSLYIKGAGENNTIISVATDFPTSVNGVFDFSQGDGMALPVGGLYDCSVVYTQPDSTNLASYTHWPPAFYTNGNYHSEVRNVTIVCGWTGISIQGNNNGATFTNIRGSCFSKLFDIQTTGTCFDPIYIDEVVASTVGMTSVNQINTLLTIANGAVCFTCGTVDGIFMNKVVTAVAAGSFNTGGDTFAALAGITNSWFDVGGLSVFDGTVLVSNCTFVNGTGACAKHLGGRLLMSNCNFSSNGTSQGSNYGVIGQAAKSTVSIPLPELHITGCIFDTVLADNNSLLVTVIAPYTGKYFVHVTGNSFNRTTNTAYVNQTVLVASGSGDTRLEFVGNSFSEVGSGSGTAFQATDDTYHVIDGNQFGGYIVNLVAQTKISFGAGNTHYIGATPAYLSGASFTGTLSPATFAPLRTENYIATETGATNAIAFALKDAANVNIPLIAGTKFSVLLAHTLQIGANTATINAVAKNIKCASNPANNLARGYAIGGMFTGIYDGTQVLDISQ